MDLLQNMLHIFSRPLYSNYGSEKKESIILGINDY